MPSALDIQVPSPIQKGSSAPSRVVSPSKLRDAKLPFSENLARDIESLSQNINNLHRAIANSGSISIPAATTNSPGVVKTNGTTIATDGGGTLTSVTSNVRSATANTTFAATDYTIFADASGAAFTVLLPPNPDAGEIHNLKKTDASFNAVTLDGNGKNIDEAPSIVLLFQDWAVTVQYDGVGWRIF